MIFDPCMIILCQAEFTGKNGNMIEFVVFFQWFAQVHDALAFSSNCHGSPLIVISEQGPFDHNAFWNLQSLISCFHYGMACKANQ